MNTTYFDVGDPKPEALTDALAIARANLDMANAHLADAHKQIAALTASNRALYRQPGLLRQCIEAETATITDRLTAVNNELETLLKAVAGNYVEADALIAIQVALYDIQMSNQRMRARFDAPANGAE